LIEAEEVRRAALALPEAIEVETWGQPTFRVRDKIFAVLSPDGDVAGVKATLEAQAALIGSDPATFSPSHYTGRYGWTTVQLARVDPAEMLELVVEAWRQTAPRKLAASFPGAS
jgi:hypothetical protein